MVDPFKSPNFEVPAEMRDLANKSVEQAKRAFDSFMGATHQAAGSIETSAQTMQDGAKSAARQMVEYAEQNVKAAFDHAQALVQANGIEQVMRLQTEYMRSQMSALQDQMKSMGGAAQAMGQSVSQSVGKTMQEAMKPKK